jgi:hypothetical protein
MSQSLCAVPQDFGTSLRELTSEEVELVSGGDWSWYDVAVVGAAAIVVGAIAVGVAIPLGAAFAAGTVVYGLSGGAALMTGISIGATGSMSIAFGGYLLNNALRQNSW